MGLLYFRAAGGPVRVFWDMGTNSGFLDMVALPNIKGAFPLSKAGERSTSLGMMPLLSKFNMPSLMPSSDMGGGSAKGSSR